MSLGFYDDLGQQEGGGIQACREVHKGRVTTFSGVKKIKIKLGFNSTPNFCFWSSNSTLNFCL
jgi:hypothetical protein